MPGFLIFVYTLRQLPEGVTAYNGLGIPKGVIIREISIDIPIERPDGETSSIEITSFQICLVTSSSEK